MKILHLALLLTIAASAAASPVITSVTPSSGPSEGGTRVTIRGTGFSEACVVCATPFSGLSVYFGTTRATEVDLIDSTRIDVVTPPRLPGTVSVTVHQMDSTDSRPFTLPDAFTFTGTLYDGFEPILFPIFMPPVRGAFGSEFHTTARMASRGEAFEIYGVDTTCTLIDPPIHPTDPFRVGGFPLELYTGCSDSVGRLFFIPRVDEPVRHLVANLRVADVTRQHESHGVEIPVVREGDFVRDKIVLLGVPVDPRFRNTLRIYGLPGAVESLRVTVNGVATRVTLPRSENLFEPRYAQFTNFPTLAQLPAGQTTVTVVVEDPLGGRGIAGATPFWAFVSVTNNDTQHITTITPN